MLIKKAIVVDGEKGKHYKDLKETALTTWIMGVEELFKREGIKNESDKWPHLSAILLFFGNEEVFVEFGTCLV